MRRVLALAALAVTLTACGREHPSAATIADCLNAHGARDVRVVTLNAAPLRVHDDWDGVQGITFRIQVPSSRLPRFPPGDYWSGGIVIVARGDRDAVRIRNELRSAGEPFKRRRSVLFFPPGHLTTMCA